jgi:GNAT superfamily N-acetyltransferase
MVPLAQDAAELVLSRVEGTRRAVALHHALIWRRPGLWGDHPSRPNSVVLLRQGDTQWEAFGAGDSEPAVSWLAARGGAIALLAPASWEKTVRRVIGPVERVRIEVRSYGHSDHRSALTPPGPARRAITPRRLTSADAAAFEALAPAWALRGWGSFSDLIAYGAGFGVPGGAGFAALAWIQEQGRHLDVVGVVVASRFRRLGLGRAVSATLVAHIIGQRHRRPLWVTTPQNVASRALARSLGFTRRAGEVLLRWPADS